MPDEPKSLEAASEADRGPLLSPWSHSAPRVVAALEVDTDKGLDPSESARRLQVHGPNALASLKPRSPFAIFAAQFRSLLVVLLAAAVAVSLVFAQWVEALAVLVVILLNGLIGFVTELRAVRSMEALRKLGVTHVTVRRGGHLERIDSEQLVPGDVVVLEGGDVVAADMRLVDASRLQANESTLTGESVPVGKRAEVLPDSTPLPERKNMLFRGTSITRGAAVAVVVATAKATELGHISDLVEGAEQETTPLEQRLSSLGQALVWVTLTLAVAIGGVSIMSGTEIMLAIETAIALAVASVPEGLPIIATLALARGMRMMAARNALVNRLSAVETLGATSIICTDKTGTLTENKMTVALYELASGTIDVSSDDNEVAFHSGQRPVTPIEGSDLLRALRIGVLCNDAELGDQSVGDPLEIALLAVGIQAGLTKNRLESEMPRVREVAFDPDLRMMATVHRQGAGFFYAIKGGPEAVLAVCARKQTGEVIDEVERERLLAIATERGARGARLLGLAYKVSDNEGSQAYEELIWVGLVGLADPARTDVIPAIRACQGAGIRVVMVTGDQAATASSIASAVGLEGELEARLGGDLDGWSERAPEDQDALSATSVFARVSPEQKLKLITLHQKRGAVVAMTGDGVNDAPALKKADIGIAMGQRGTAVAREAADMVLRDDSFASIVAAVHEGRVIFANIRAFVVYLLSCNLSEILVVGLATLLGGGLPLLPLQILFLNLVTDVFPALALGASSGSPGLMKRRPRSKLDSIVGRAQWREIATFGLVMTASVLGAFFVAKSVLELDPRECVSVSFLTLALAQLWHVFNMRAGGSHVLKNEVTTNVWVWRAVALCLLLLAVAVYFPPLARVLAVVPPSAEGWAIIVVASVATLVFGQLTLLARQEGDARD